ncbi:hypothetical protein [Helicobacter burdigaliensis]|uniref:hypothetical protein n=1 Tax=Helicobacter burdigaliensis TaxID=2315334 RepID=UPI002FCD963D
MYDLGKPAEAKSKKSMIFDTEYNNIFNNISAENILYKYKIYLYIENKKEELSNTYSFLKYATYYLLYFSATYINNNNLKLSDINHEEVYNFAFKIIQEIVEKEKKNQGDNFLENVLFKGNIPKKYISELDLELK